jgi:hypothetical protein
MLNSTLPIVSIALLTLALSGCGFFLALPSECRNELPTIEARNVLWWDWKNPPKPSTKEDFLKEWGPPKSILSTSENKETGFYETRLSPSTENRETWVYERRLWCGFGPIFAVVPIPLLLSVCDGFERIEFQGNEAKNLHIRRIRTGGGIIIPYYLHGASDPVCRYNIDIDMGMDREQVVEHIGKPYKIMHYSLEDKQIDVLYYIKGTKRSFGSPAESDLVPVVFENNIVTGWGKNAFEFETIGPIVK